MHLGAGSALRRQARRLVDRQHVGVAMQHRTAQPLRRFGIALAGRHRPGRPHRGRRSEEHTSELQSLMRISYAVFCLKKKKNTNKKTTQNTTSQINNKRYTEEQA